MTSKLHNTTNTDLQQNDALLQSPALPPRNVLGTHTNVGPHVENHNIFRVLLKNRRQISSLAAGNFNIRTELNSNSIYKFKMQIF